MRKRKHRGSAFGDFLCDENISEEAEGRALNRGVSLQLTRILKENSVSKRELAARMKTNNATVDRLLNASNSSVTLNTLAKAARVLGHRIKIEFI